MDSIQKLPLFEPKIPLCKKRKTIAALTSSLVSVYHKELLLGMSDVAEENGVNFVAFTGGPLRPPDEFIEMRNYLYNIINPEVFDGLIVPSSSLSRYSSVEDFHQFLQRFKPLPIVTIGSGYPDMPSIKADYTAGMKAILEHLITVHNRRRIAFIRGPVNNLTSQERNKVYNAVLEKYGIALDPDLIVTGDISRESGTFAVQTLLEDRKVQFDAMVSVSDTLAIGAIQELTSRGIRVPDDVGVVGFQNLIESIFVNPPLTTVSEVMYEQGRHAMETMLSLIAGDAVPAESIIPTKLVIRQTCGCHLHSQEQLDPVSITDNEPLKNKTPEEMLTSTNKTCTASSVNSDVLELLQSALKRTMEDGNTELFNRVLQQTLFQMEHRLLLYQDFQIERLINLFRQIGYNLISNFDLPRIMQQMTSVLKIEHCYISLYEGHQHPAEWSRLIMAYKNKQYLSLPENGIKYPTNHLLPEQMFVEEKACNMVVEPLYFRGEHLGYIMFNIGYREGSIYEALQAQISGALKNELQLQELRAAEERFSDIAHSSSDWLWEVDSNCRFTYCSDGVIKVLGYSAQEMLGKTLFDFLRTDEDEYVNSLNIYISQKQPVANLENWNHHKDGHLVGLLISGTPILKNDGQLIGYRGIFKDITESKRAEEKIKFMAYYDLLTELPNRTLFNDRAEIALAQAQRDKNCVALMFIDLDRFKTINDNLGHAAGDQLLQKVAERLKNCVQESDTLARLGGDEFSILLPNIKQPEDATIVAKKILKALNEPFDLIGHHFFITTSIGIALYPFDGKDIHVLLKNADTAMYRAKDQGRNRFMFYDNEMEVKSAKRMRLENSMHKALERGEFQLYYQPQVDCITREIKGLEALLRWNSTELGLISPADFIPIAEETGLIVPIGEWVLRSAIEQQQKWHQLGYKDMVIAVNLSAYQFRNNELAETFAHILEETKADPRFIELEVTESAFIENQIFAIETLHKFKKMGMRIALDDFGTGYSSLSYLKRLPIDTVKIDKSFIGDATADSDSAAIIRAIIAMTKSLKLDVIAEGVETKEQYEFLKFLDCDELQGYLFCKPLPADEITTFLKHHPEMLEKTS